MILTGKIQAGLLDNLVCLLRSLWLINIDIPHLFRLEALELVIFLFLNTVNMPLDD